ncbi:MAG: MarR family winged helix-turn-helix transcriptional regulator [Cyanobacteria bacterium P01_D01_bin.71]
MSNNHARFYKNRPLSVLLWIRLIRVVQKISRNAQGALTEAGLTGPQFDLLVHIQLTPGVSQKEITQRLKVTKGNVSQLIEKLEQKGLLKRNRQGRNSYLTLTNDGTYLVERMLPEHDAFIENQFSALTSDEQQQLFAILRKLTPE